MRDYLFQILAIRQPKLAAGDLTLRQWWSNKSWR
jgi:hypothetical protein